LTENSKNTFPDKGWLKLDNAAKLFPAIISDDLTSVFRITAALKDPIRYSSLREAVAITSKRFPYFNVTLGAGIFWHFLELNNFPPAILPDKGTPCTAFDIRNKNLPLYRIILKGKKISVEFSHIITDGGGAMEYLKSLVFTYLTLTGKPVTTSENIILPGSPIAEEEYEDAYNKFFQKLPQPVKLAKAWHLPFSLETKPKLKIISAEVNTCEILDIVHRYKVSITEYFVAVYIYSIQEIFIEREKENKNIKRKVIRIEVPVNMRNKLPSRTMRNFSLFVLPEIDLRLGTYSFEEVLKSVHHQLQISSDIKQILRFLSSNVGYERLYVVRALPLFIKKIAISAVYRSLASRRWSGILTNLGVIKLPADMENLIDSLEIIPPPPNRQVKVSCALISYRDRLRIIFSNISGSNELEKKFIRHLSNAGVHVRIMNNN
jgi:NRPS condensation-like uncharacterized protein